MFKRNNKVVYGSEEVRPFVLNRYRKLRTNGFSEEEIANCIVLNAAERKVLEKEFDVFDKTKSDILKALDVTFGEVPVEVDASDKEEEVNVYVPDKKKSPFDEAMAKLEQLEKVVCKYIKTTEPEAKETKKETKPEAKQTKPEAKEAKKETAKPEAKETKKETKPQAKPEVVSNFNAADVIKQQLEKAKKETKPQAKPEVVSNFNAADIIKQQLEKAKQTKPETKEAKKETAKPEAKETKPETKETKKETKPEAKETKKETKPEAKETKKETKPEYKNENIDGVDYVYLPIGEDEMQNLVEDIKENYEDLYDVTLNADKLEKCIVNILADTHILDDANTYLELFNATLSKMDELIDSNTVELGNATEEDELLKNLNSIFED